MFSFFKKKFAPAPAPAAPAAPAPSGDFDIPMPGWAGARSKSFDIPLNPPAAEAEAQADAPAKEFDIPILEQFVPVEAPPQERTRWIEKLRQGLQKTGSNLSAVFARTTIDDELYEELEAALLMADAGVKATEFLLADLKRRVKETKATEPTAVKVLLADGSPSCWHRSSGRCGSASTRRP